MAGLTARFKLNRFGGGTPGTISDDGQKYTSTDRDTIDRLLAQTEKHDHHYRPAATGLGVAASLALTASGGTLEAGQSYFYRYSVVDSAGTEGLASPVASVVAPALLPAPPMPSPYVNPADGGSLPFGVWFYALTALRGTEETPLGGAATISTIAGEGTVRLTLPALGGADSFRVWRMGMNEAGFTKLGVTSAAEFVDSGAVPSDPCACDPGNQPPLRNTGVSIYSVTVTLPADVDLTSARSWRLYRSPYPTFGTAALVHEVVEHQSEWDTTTPLLRAWTDTGGQLRAGAPLDSDINMRFGPFTFDSAEALPDPVPYPANYPIVVAGKLYAKVGAAWALVGGAATSGSSASSILTAPGGARFMLTVSDAGVLSTAPTSFPGPPTSPQTFTAS